MDLNLLKNLRINPNSENLPLNFENLKEKMLNAPNSRIDVTKNLITLFLLKIDLFLKSNKQKSRKRNSAQTHENKTNSKCTNKTSQFSDETLNEYLTLEKNLSQDDFFQKVELHKKLTHFQVSELQKLDKIQLLEIENMNLIKKTDKLEEIIVVYQKEIKRLKTNRICTFNNQGNKLLLLIEEEKQIDFKKIKKPKLTINSQPILKYPKNEILNTPKKVFLEKIENLECENEKLSIKILQFKKNKSQEKQNLENKTDKISLLEIENFALSSEVAFQVRKIQSFTHELEYLKAEILSYTKRDMFLLKFGKKWKVSNPNIESVSSQVDVLKSWWKNSQVNKLTQTEVQLNAAHVLSDCFKKVVDGSPDFKMLNSRAYGDINDNGGVHESLAVICSDDRMTKYIGRNLQNEFESEISVESFDD